MPKKLGLHVPVAVSTSCENRSMKPPIASRYTCSAAPPSSSAAAAGDAVSGAAGDSADAGCASCPPRRLRTGMTAGLGSPAAAAAASAASSSLIGVRGKCQAQVGRGVNSGRCAAGLVICREFARHRIRRVPYIGVPRAVVELRMQRGQLIGGPQARVPLYVPYADFFQYQAGAGRLAGRA